MGATTDPPLRRANRACISSRLGYLRDRTYCEARTLGRRGAAAFAKIHAETAVYLKVYYYYVMLNNNVNATGIWPSGGRGTITSGALLSDRFMRK